MAEGEDSACRQGPDCVFNLCIAALVCVLRDGGGRREPVIGAGRVQSVSDLKPGDRMAGERTWGLCPASGVAHRLYPTPPPAVRFLLNVSLSEQFHTEYGDR